MPNQSNPSQAEQNAAKHPKSSEQTAENENIERSKCAGLDILKHEAQKHLEGYAPKLSTNDSPNNLAATHKSIKAGKIKKKYSFKSITLRMVMIYAALVIVTAILVIIF